MDSLKGLEANFRIIFSQRNHSICAGALSNLLQTGVDTGFGRGGGTIRVAYFSVQVFFFPDNLVTDIFRVF